MPRWFLYLIFAGWSLRTSAHAAPLEWIDPDTGHRVVRLSDKAGQVVLYFHQNGFTQSGDQIVLASARGLMVYNFEKRSIEPLVNGATQHVIVAKRRRKVYYLKGESVCETDIDTKTTRVLCKDNRLSSGSGFAINADETELAGSMITGECPAEFLRPIGNHDRHPSKAARMEARLAAKIPMALYTLNIQTGAIHCFHASTDWLSHVQFSPTDPKLLMFCHEGPWHKVDRIWTIRTDGSQLRKIHTRSMPREIAGHEFFSPDGRFIYYDLQTPRGEVFWLARYDVHSGELKRDALTKPEWSVHYNISPDGTLFCGDGGGPNSVAKGNHGPWIYLFRQRNGKLESRKLVNLAKHDYALEPNATFTPDGKWLVFRSNLSGQPHTYAVEIKKAARENHQAPNP